MVLWINSHLRCGGLTVIFLVSLHNEHSFPCGFMGIYKSDDFLCFQ